jgi:hypothetical protein
MPARVAAHVALFLLSVVMLPNAYAATAYPPVQTIRLDDLGKPEAQLNGN